MNPVIASSGKLGSMSCQFVAFDLGPNSATSWSTVRQSMPRSGLTATVSASVATDSSVYSTPFSSQTGTSSSSLIGREASEMSVAPVQNTSKPPPVPDWPTVTWIEEPSAVMSSCAAVVIG